ncbi:hypothetical protein BGZ98_004766 [Dissophora globulifera]|nr:hypothetical protein BGZ98_004766 [Dissophora globulifera]
MTPDRHGELLASPLCGQVVHARKCYKRLFFIDLRISPLLKVTVLFRSDDARPRLPAHLSDQGVAALWKRVKRGDTISLHPFAASEDEVSKREHPVYQAVDFTVLKAWPSDYPFPTEPAMGFVGDTSASSTLPRPESITAMTVTIETENDDPQETALGAWDEYCKFWINSQRCLKADCRKKHPTGDDYTKAQELWVKERTQIRRERSKLQDDPHAVSSKVPHSQRAFIFCRWLVNTFGVDYLNSGSGVLDVAGGKGEISLFLTHMFGIRSTVVEPNVRRDKPYQRKNLMGVIQRQLDIESGGDGLSFKKLPVLTSAPPPNDDEVVDGKEKAAAGFQESDIGESESAKKERRRLKKLQRDQFTVPRLSTLLDDKFALDYGDMLQGASILIGMHPDQATEPIVDMALKHNKPFAVVPCCVFALDNPHRRLASGGEVNTTLEFIQYLIEKARSAESLHKEFLPFDGMNIVVYRPLSGLGLE